MDFKSSSRALDAAGRCCVDRLCDRCKRRLSQVGVAHAETIRHHHQFDRIIRFSDGFAMKATHLTPRDSLSNILNVLSSSQSQQSTTAIQPMQASRVSVASR
jgi:hypothetical protein